MCFCVFRQKSPLKLVWLFDLLERVFLHFQIQAFLGQKLLFRL